MEAPELEKMHSGPDEVTPLNRSRSLKSKQLVRSQALRETQSPPRTVSPNAVSNSVADEPEDCKDRTQSDQCSDVIPSSRVINNHNVNNRDVFSDYSDDKVPNNRCSSDNNVSGSDVDDGKKQPVEIQITSGAWESEVPIDQRQRTRLWLGFRAGDLLSNGPRVACVCGECRPRARIALDACPDCRGRRCKDPCPMKQDSGIVCSDECPDCSDSENDPSPPRPRDSESLDLEQSETNHICRCSERKDKVKNPSLSRTDSDEKSEPNGVDLINFIKETLNKNPKDRMTLLKIERDLQSLVSDPGRCVVRFPVMTSYGRLLVHRCAALFQLSHRLDHTNKSAVLVSKNGTSGGCIPCTNFRAWCTTTFHHNATTINNTTSTNPHDMQAKSILKRATLSLEEGAAAGGAGGGARSKSLEQREREYERVRRRIFSSEESQWPWMNSGPVKLLTPEAGTKNRLLKVQSLESPSPAPRGPVAKSHSFGGYEPPPPPPRLLSRQGDLASSSWRLSPSSSGYKTLSFRSTDSVTPSPTGGVSPEPGAGGLVWAVTDLSSVPPGALIIHPQTGRPLTNPDGSIYHYDPVNPPIFTDVTQSNENKIDQSPEKRRGRLEKQHSFMENEYDCQTEEYQGKCCCECKREDWSQQPQTNDAEATYCDPEVCQELPQQCEPSEHLIQTKQCENQYDQSPCEMPANQEAPPAEPTIQEPHVEQDGGHYNENYNEAYSNDIGHNVHQEVSNQMYIQEAAQAHKAPPVLYNDPNIRHISMGSPVYSTMNNQQTYVYANQARIEPERPPLRAPPYAHAHAPPCAGACAVDAATGLAHCVLQRSYSLSYGQPVDTSAVIPQTYPMNNVVLPQHSMSAQYPYSPALQWPAGLQPLMAPAMPPNCATPQKSTPPPNIYYAPPEIPISYHPTQLGYAKQPEMIGYPINNQVYPLLQYPYQGCPLITQVVPSYPGFHQVYPMLEKSQRRNSGVRSYESAQRFNSKKNSISGSSRTTPLERYTPPTADGMNNMYYDKYEKAKLVKQTSFNEVTHDADARRRFQRAPSLHQEPAELAVKIQHIKEQMALMSAAEPAAAPAPRRARHPNPSPGLLGSHPTARDLARHKGQHPLNDESQLNSTARAIVHSIRQNIQVKNYHGDRRHEYQNDRQYNSYENRYRKDYRQARPRPDAERGPQVEKGRGFPPQERPKYEGQGQGQARPEAARGHAAPFPYRAPYMLRQMSPAWCRRSPGPFQPSMNQPRRPPPDTRNGRY